MLSKENFEKIKEYIYRKSGIALEYDKHYEKVCKKLASRYEALGIDDFRKYFFKLRFEDKDGSEFQELISLLTVNETYFFRENHQFEVLINHIMPELHAKKRNNELIRILSAPCSSGEEPFSIVIHLLEEKNIVNQRDIEIIGIDIDKSIIEKAKMARYSERSLHALPQEIKNRYFKKSGLFYELLPEYKQTVDFRIVNVFDKPAMLKLGKFDVIFSRNMLIYFDDASRKEVAMTFYEMLNFGGYVILGHAEYMSRIVSVYTPKKFDNVLVYQK